MYVCTGVRTYVCVDLRSCIACMGIVQQCLWALCMCVQAYIHTYVLCVCQLCCIALYGHSLTEVMSCVYVCTGLHTFVCVSFVV